MEINSVLLFALMVVGSAQGLPKISCAEYCISRTSASDQIGSTSWRWRDACKCYYNRLEPVQLSQSQLTPSISQDILPLLPSPVDDTSIYYQPAVNAPLQPVAALVHHPFYILNPTFKPTPPEKATKKRKADKKQAVSSSCKNNCIDEEHKIKEPVYLDIVIAEGEEGRSAKNSGPYLSENDLSECIDLHILAYTRKTNNVTHNITISINNLPSYESMSDADIKLEIEKKCSQAHSLVNETIYEILATRPKKTIQTRAHDLNDVVSISGTDQQICSTELSTIPTERSARTNNLEDEHDASKLPHHSTEDKIMVAETNIQNVPMTITMDYTSTKSIDTNMASLPSLASAYLRTTDIPQSYQIINDANHTAEDSKGNNSLEISTTIWPQTKVRPLPDMGTESDKRLENDRANRIIFENPITTAGYTDIRDDQNLYSTFTDHSAIKDKTEDDMQTVTSADYANALKNESDDSEIHSTTVNYTSLKKQAVDKHIHSHNKHAIYVIDPVFTTDDDDPNRNNSEIEDVLYNVSSNEKRESSDPEFSSPDTTLSAVEDYTEEIPKRADNDMNLETIAVNNHTKNGITESSDNNEQKRATNHVILTSTEVASIKVEDQLIPKIITRELFNDTVVSESNGVETEPEDFIENDVALKVDRQQKDNKNSTRKLADGKSSEIIGNLYFKSNNAEVPVRLTQNAEGRLSLGIDGDSLCDKLLYTGNRKVFFTILCDCVRSNRC